MIGGLVNGGFAYIKHYVLRFLLWRNGYAPLNYIRFLDYAAERVFLRKVGGGYIFTHRLLMEYFATLLPADGARQSKDLVAALAKSMGRVCQYTRRGASAASSTRIR